MKAFVISGLLLLLISGMWRCSGQQPVLVECNYLNLRVVAKRALFYPDELVGPDELFLGTDCRVTFVRPHEFEFNIPIQNCGIVVEIVVDRTIFYSWLTYKPKNLQISAELPLKCVVPRSVQNTCSLIKFQRLLAKMYHCLSTNLEIHNFFFFVLFSFLFLYREGVFRDPS
ncbi:oocyte-secreted protein 3-like [Alexandromys fortis]|uniref:oocyte-secreted protein 3-like n=1 Tax=Alexandromys fortis TaxID=100897 RepID=UPI0021528E96|nr:oocyte-secreted protein 3-like [Microtus fortis]